MKVKSVGYLALIVLSCCWLRAAVAGPAPESGVDRVHLDPAVRPQDDFYRYVNDRWMSTNEIPPYMAKWGAGTELQVRVFSEARSLLEGLVAAPNLTDAEQRKLVDLYASYMDQRAVDAAGLQPLSAELGRIRRIDNRHDISAMIAHLTTIGLDSPINVEVNPDAKQSERYIFELDQGGIGLPDRDYYLSDQQRFSEIREKYRAHVERLLALAGDERASGDGADVVALETQIARVQWTRVANRDPVATYNRMTPEALAALAPGIDWSAFFAEADLAGHESSLDVNQPTYLAGLGGLIGQTPAAVWKAYFLYRLVDQLSPYLAKAFVDETLSFYGATLRGQTATRPRWLKAVGFVDDRMGDALGRLYVATHFPPGAKAHAEQMLDNIAGSFRSRIESLDWMGADSKRAAQAKLTKLKVKLGSPDKWRDYTTLHTTRDLASNVLACGRFEYARNIAKIGQVVDLNEWGMSPLQVNGYYSASRNEVVLPAALMQPPYFQPNAEDAVNYGGLGFFISHELSHAFDSGGSRYDADGNIHEWMSEEDRERFNAKTRALVDQYAHYEALPGLFVNGELTLRENIADVSGLAIAHDAYHRSLKGRPAPVLDGLEADQRFYIAFATTWASKEHEQDVVAQIKADTHSPGQFRVNGSVVNQDPFYVVFGVKEGDGMYLPIARRVVIW